MGVIRYADDFVIICKTKKEAEAMYQKLSPYLDKRGLTLAENKTKVTHISEGFDFLGFNLRQYKTKTKTVLLIKPSKDSVKKAKQTIKTVFKKLRGNPVKDIITQLNPIIRGLGNYWSGQASKVTYRIMDRYVWIKIKKYLKTLHPKKPFKWIRKRYFKPDYTGVSKDKWLLTDPHDEKTQIFKMQWIPIVRHVLIKYRNSPDDASLKDYFDERDKKEFILNSVLSRRKIAKRSSYKCRICNQSLADEEPIKINYVIPKLLGGEERYDNYELLHQSCHKQYLQLLEKYGGGKTLTKALNYFEKSGIEPNSQEGYKLMRKAFKRFKYQFV